MAESLVTFLLEKLDRLLEGELALLGTLHKEVQFIRDELQSMQAFLRDADRREETNESIKVWVKQVRQVAYDTEDVLDNFLFCLQQKSQQGGIVGYFLKAKWFIKDLKLQHRIATQIQEIKGRVEEISNRSKRYDFNSGHEQGSSTKSIHDSRNDALLLEENELVGMTHTKGHLIRLLVKGEPRLEVISVVGMGGLGKTTLVKKVYDDLKIRGDFHYQAWVIVTQSFKVEALLKDILAQFFKKAQQPIPAEVETMDEVKLKNEVKNFLQEKRYVVVLDDIWSMGAWDALKYAFPKSNCGSRIIVTTRSKDVGKSCGHVYELHPLPQEESWKLFCMKAFQSNTCPSQLEDLSIRMLKRCEGLPLVIVTLGSLLSTKEKTTREWEMVFRSLGVELQSNDHLGHVKRILYLSYIDLPYYLKYCFLYSSMFPENHVIDCNQLVQLWSAERFVEQKRGMTTEEVAESYLHKLINRSLIQITATHRDGRPRKCRIHDLMREIILSKSMEECFGAIVAEKASPIPEKIRRLSIQDSKCTALQNSTFPHLRSLFTFVEYTLPNSSTAAFFASFKLLRVLVVSNAPLKKFPSAVANLIHLRYLSMRRTKLERIPNSIGKLQNLETLDFNETDISQFPNGILKLKRLHCLTVVRHKWNSFSYSNSIRAEGFKIFKGIGSLVSLQKLHWIEVDQGSDLIRDLERLSELRNLGVLKLKMEDGIHLCSSIEKMTQLQTLSIYSTNEEALDLQYLNSPPSSLERLYLKGSLEKLPRWICSVDNLVTIALRYSRLRDDPLESIQNLPNLTCLELVEAYEGETICFKSGGFQNLKILDLRALKHLRLIQVEEQALPHLQKLEIYECLALKKVPLGIEYLSNLKELWFFDMSDEFLHGLFPDKGNKSKDHWRIAHIQSVYVRQQGDQVAKLIQKADKGQAS